MKIKFISLLLLSILFISCHGQTYNAVNTIDVKSFAEKHKKKYGDALKNAQCKSEYHKSKGK